MIKKSAPSTKVKKKVESKPKKLMTTISSQEYVDIFLDIKNKIQETQIRAAVAANKKLIYLYWTIGNIMHNQQKWGNKFIEKLVVDLQNEFPGIEGFSRSNLFRMRAFYYEYHNCRTSGRQFDDTSELGILSSIPWAHNIVLMEKIKSKKERIWYAQKAIEV